MEILRGSRRPCREIGQTALHAAASKGHQEVVAVLLEHPGFDHNVVTLDTDWSSLHLAVSGGHYKVVALLLQQPGIEVNLPHYIAGWTPLHIAAIFGACPDMVEILLKQPGININARDREGWTALHRAARYDHEEILRLLLDQPGIDEKATTNRGLSVLHAAASGFGGPNILRRLLTSPSTDPNVRDNLGKTPIMLLLHPALHNNSAQQVKRLQAMVEFNRVDLDLKTPEGASLEDLAR